MRRSASFAVVSEACKATAVKLIGVVMKALADVGLLVCVQFVEFFQQCECLGSDEACHVEGGFFLPGHCQLSPQRGGSCVVASVRHQVTPL